MGEIFWENSLHFPRELLRGSRREEIPYVFLLWKEKKKKGEKNPKLVIADYSGMKENSCLLQLPTPREGRLKALLKVHVKPGFMELSQALCSLPAACDGHPGSQEQKAA